MTHKSIEPLARPHAISGKTSRYSLGNDWMKTLPQPWTVAMEATIFSGWIYDICFRTLPR